jgi:hypothetical protein
LALDVAREALESAKRDEKAAGRIASYYELMSKCAEAIPDISAAVAHCKEAIESGAGVLVKNTSSNSKGACLGSPIVRAFF